MRMFLVCLTDDPFDPAGEGGHGGSHPFISDLGRFLIAGGANVTYVSRLDRPEKEPVQELGPGGRILRLRAGPEGPVPYYVVGNHTAELGAALDGLLREQDLGSEDRVISYNWISGEAVRLASACCSAPHVHYVLALGRSRLMHGEDPSKVSEHWLACERQVFSHACMLIVPSRAERNELVAHYPETPAEKVVVLPDAVDTDIFSPRPRSHADYLCRTSRRFSERVADAVRRPVPAGAHG